MDNLWFDQQAFIDASKEQGGTLEICSMQITQPSDAFYGIPEQKEWTCKPLSGYSITEKMSLVATNNGTSAIKDSKEIVYVFPDNFNPAMVNENTYFKVKGRLSQITLIDTIVHRGTTILYKYQVEETSLSVD
ncbi:hypothetical protein FD723_40020 (plasmid) [Nostoc sp. C052]|uniref:hypothetical protein n=1 Tax=Nostoc sp. C052 TaxID=2576902 RepID=UPI0015C40253|nr:hypothetical protein [Nostoc sp. C052]QLE46401.1 hypothetical protein FD723_40020 [Nostoc sp. C052]